jgi:hypothetical protein
MDTTGSLQRCPLTRVPFAQHDNLFTRINDFSMAQKLSDSLDVEQLHRFLDRCAQDFRPILDDVQSVYHWSIMQAEYATDILFSSPKCLAPLYDRISRTAAVAVKAPDIATFLGRKLSANYLGEMGNYFSTRIEGTRIRHGMGPTSIKIYDKFGIALRIEIATNDVSFFKHFRDVERDDGSIVNKIASMRKSIYGNCRILPGSCVTQTTATSNSFPHSMILQLPRQNRNASQRPSPSTITPTRASTLRLGRPRSPTNLLPVANSTSPASGTNSYARTLTILPLQNNPHHQTAQVTWSHQESARIL